MTPTPSIKRRSPPWSFIPSNVSKAFSTGEQLQRQGILQERLNSLIESMRASAAKAGTTAGAGKELYQETEALNRLLGQFSLDVVCASQEGIEKT